MELAESHLVPRGVYDLCGIDGETVMLTEKAISFTGRHLKHPLLCVKCEGALSSDGEDWTIPLLADNNGNFPLYDLLQKVPPDCADDTIAGYAASRNPEIDVQKLTHFALGVFWKASVHSWRGGETDNWIELGPYSEEIRRFLRSEGPFPKYVSLAVAISPKPVKQISFCLPYLGSKDTSHFYAFHVPGIVFSLSVGKGIPQATDTCFYSNPLHPIIMAELAGDIRNNIGVPMTNAEIVFAAIVGAISAIGLIWGSILTSRASDRASQSAREAMEHQTKLNAKAKIAEFRQAWINNLRDAMAKLMGQGYGAHAPSDVIEATAKIQLLMNKKDGRYPQLTKSMKQYVIAMKSADQQYDSSEFIGLCQDILKNEWEVLKKELLELKAIG
jgi:hypothetical protein